MAQIQSNQQQLWRRVSIFLQGHKGALVACVLVVVALVGAVTLGVGCAQRNSMRIYHDEESGQASLSQGERKQSREKKQQDVDAVEDDKGQKRDGATSDKVVVDVVGAVRAPGVYELEANSRINDALEKAGGVLPEADTAGINRAALLSDGQHIYVPVKGEQLPSLQPGVSGAEDTGSLRGAGVVNINTASLEELDALPGVGPSTAQAILDDREKNGPFSSPEDLMRVSGIGEKKFEKIRDLICV